MLTTELNDRLTQIGPNTPMGNLMRHYWMPVAGASELDDAPTKKVRVLGEDLVLYRDLKGRMGLIAEKCAHRRVSMVYGIPEEDGLRCPYHGWLYNGQGVCLEQPAEPEESTFKDRICVVAYPVQELGGLVFAYLGPLPAPPLPKYNLYTWDNTIRRIGYTIVPANWLQIMENSLDSTHLEWLHGRFFDYVLERQNKPVSTFKKKHVKFAFDLFDHGIVKRRLMEGETEDADEWRIGHPVVFPNILLVGHGERFQFQIRVPMDDNNTIVFWYTCFRPDDADAVQVPEQKSIPVYEAPYKDENGKLFVDSVDGQDIMCWVTQGNITDRSLEKIGTSDKGVIMFRQLLQEQLAKLERGEKLLAVIDEAQKDDVIQLPMGKKVYYQRDTLSTVEGAPTWRFMPNKDEILNVFKQVVEKRAKNASNAASLDRKL